MTAALPWVFLPGWGMSAASLMPLKEALADEEVTLLSWPDDPKVWEEAAAGCLDGLFLELMNQHPQPAIWLGWSLGGLVAAKMAEDPRFRLRLAGLVSVGIGPWFAASQDKPCRWGVSPAELKAFARYFKKQPKAAWTHFLEWQSQGEMDGRLDWVDLHKLSEGEKLPRQPGLQLLQTLEAIHLIESPDLDWLFVRGDKDPLCEDWTPLQSCYPSNRLSWVTLKACGHLPQLTVAEQLAAQLRQWRSRL